MYYQWLHPHRQYLGQTAMFTHAILSQQVFKKPYRLQEGIEYCIYECITEVNPLLYSHAGSHGDSKYKRRGLP